MKNTARFFIPQTSRFVERDHAQCVVSSQRMAGSMQYPDKRGIGSMLSSTLFEIVLILVLILANGIFAAAEIAVVSARKGRLEQEAERGRYGARVALELADNPNHFLSTVQVGITLIGTLAAAFGGANIAEVLADALRMIPAFEPYAATLALGAVVLVISYVSLILGELVPKRIALQNAEGIAIRLAPLMHGLGRFTSPVVRFLTFSSELVLRLLGRHNIEEIWC